MRKRILIIGGSRGIGNKTAELLNPQFDLINISRSEASSALFSESFYCDAVYGDLPEIDGPLSGLVYCPGSINLKPFTGLTDKDFQQDWEINFLGAVKAIRKYLPNIKQESQSSIVLFSTVAAGTGMPFHASISAAKAAVEGLVKSLSAELAPKIRVNAVAPSLTKTDLAARLLRNEKQLEAAIERHPLKQIGEPEDIAEVAAFLVSDKSKWMTGQVIHADGGISAIK
jgi:3-oxoacyl-[acyl-carrier protein] reductase